MQEPEPIEERAARLLGIGVVLLRSAPVTSEPLVRARAGRELAP